MPNLTVEETLSFVNSHINNLGKGRIYGGSVRDYVNDRPSMQDCDIMFPTNFLARRFTRELFETATHWMSMSSSNQPTFSLLPLSSRYEGVATNHLGNIRIVIPNYYGDRDVNVKIDLVVGDWEDHVTNAYDFTASTLYLDEDLNVCGTAQAIQDVQNKVLRLNPATEKLSYASRKKAARLTYIEGWNHVDPELYSVVHRRSIE